MLKIVIANLFNKNKKYAAATKIQGNTTAFSFDGSYWFT